MNYMASATQPQPPALIEHAPAIDLVEGPAVGPILRVAYIGLAVFVMIFALWTALAPMSSAAIAPGMIRAEGGGRKVVQHLEGGIIEAIHVREGGIVRAGQPLVTIDGTQTEARDTAIQANYDALVAQNARLTAEREGRGRVIYPRELLARSSDPAVGSLIAASDSVFATRRNALTSQLSVLEQRLLQAGPEIASYEGQLASLADQGALLDDEATGVDALVKEGLERRSRLLALQRQQSSTDGQRSQLQGNIARARQTASETRAQMAFLRRQMLSEVAAEQREVQTKIADLGEKLTASRDVSRRRQIVAPVSGSVVNLRKVTLGGVVGAGEAILDIVPTGEKTVILVRLKPIDIDVVHPGLAADVRLTPYNARLLPLIRGRVRHVSADAMVEERTGIVYYEAEIEIDPSELRRLPGVRLVSGMPAEVFITLGARTLFEYLTQPLVDSFNRAWREP